MQVRFTGTVVVASADYEKSQTQDNLAALNKALKKYEKEIAALGPNTKLEFTTNAGPTKWRSAGKLEGVTVSIKDGKYRSEIVGRANFSSKDDYRNTSALATFVGFAKLFYSFTIGESHNHYVKRAIKTAQSLEAVGK